MDRGKEDYHMSYLQVDSHPSPRDESPSPSRPLSSQEILLQQAQHPRGFWGSQWSWEILSCVSSVGALVGIVVVLYVYDGKPMPDWPYGITLNALVSLLTTIMKAAMAFTITEALAQLKWSWFNRGNKLSDLALLDSASRGPFGALIVLFKFLPRHLVTFGCLVLVVAAAIAPFVQQVIAINMLPVHSREASSIQVCNTSLYTDYGEGAGPGMNKVPLDTTGAIYTGLFQSQTPNSNTILMNCPTGNCTFAPYQSLGFCSHCANVTDKLAQKSGASSPSDAMMSTYRYALPNGFEFTSSYSGMYLLNSTTNKPLVSINTTGLPLIMNYTAIAAAGYGMPPDISATECALYFCINTFDASVHGGAFSEHITSSASTSNFSSSSYQAATKNIALNPTDTCYVNGTAHHPPSSPECTYTVNWLSQLSMQNSLSSLLIGNGSLFVSNRPSWSSDTVHAAYGTQGTYTDINAMFSSLSSALTTHARSKVCHGTAHGTTWREQSFVRVRWQWMILPIALEGLSLVFLGITVFHTREQLIWKSSPLALLFSGLSVDEASGFAADPTLKGMESQSRRMNVWLERTGVGIRMRSMPR